MVVEVSRLTCRELCMEGAAVEGGVFNAPRDASIPESADLVAIIVAMNDFLQVRRAYMKELVVHRRLCR